MKSYYRTDFLFSKSTFWLGFGSILGVFSPYYTFNASESEHKADSIAMESDFGTIGKDLKYSFKTYSYARRK